MFKYLLFILGLSFSLITPGIAQLPAETPGELPDSLCPVPVLSRLQKHIITPQDTLESLANQYNLIPETILFNNPNLDGNSLPVGTEIIIPPINGLIVEVPELATWQDLAEVYGIRADVLFEINGCQSLQTPIFVPGMVWENTNTATLNNYTGLSGYPLPQKADIGLNYGWQNQQTEAERLFHSGVDLLADVGTVVLAAEPGIVVYAGQEGNYGKLVVINHEGGLQTRYAHLQTISVTGGQSVSVGEAIGTVGTTGKPDLDVPHLHFEVRYRTPMGWLAQDPVIHLKF